MRRIHKILAAFFLCLAILIPTDVFADSYGVYDEYDLLDEKQEAELNQRLADICGSYEFDGAILIARDIGEEKDYRMYAAEYMQAHNIGYGEGHNGMCLFHQPDARNVTIVFRGPYQDVFDTKIQDIMLDDCTAKLKEDRSFEAYMVLLDDLEHGLERAVQGKSIRPMDMDGSSAAGDVLIWFLISFAVMAIPTLVMTLYQRGKMKTNVPQSNADSYIPKSGLEIKHANDIYLRTVTTKTPIPKSNDSDSGGSGSFSCGGESFSGSGRNY